MGDYRNSGAVQGGGSRVKRYAQATVSAVAILLAAQAAMAQEQQVAQADTGVESVSVTGTRVVRDGYNAPTPVTVIGSEQIEATAPANLAQFVDQLPALMGSTTADTSAGSLSNGLAGVSSLNLRGLGANRTLVLLDGHRTPASAATGEVDINTIPQQLVKRVDVVTGGASADYGSDAVGGVVNFILDKDFTGIKGSAQYGETGAGLAPSYKVNATYGGEFLGGKAHVLVSGEFVNTEGIYNYNPSWNKSGYFKVQNPAYTATNGQPFYLIQSGIGASQVAPGGLIGIMSSGQGSIANNATGMRELYRGSKAALNMFMRSYAARRADAARPLVLMAPGWVRTDLGGADAPLSIEDSIPPLVDVLLAQRSVPGLHYLDYRGRSVPW